MPPPVANATPWRTHKRLTQTLPLPALTCCPSSLLHSEFEFKFQKKTAAPVPGRALQAALCLLARAPDHHRAVRPGRGHGRPGHRRLRGRRRRRGARRARRGDAPGAWMGGGRGLALGERLHARAPRLALYISCCLLPFCGKFSTLSRRRRTLKHTNTHTTTISRRQVNMNQRAIKLEVAANAAGAVTLNMPPPGGAVAPPGWCGGALSFRRCPPRASAHARRSCRRHTHTLTHTHWRLHSHPHTTTPALSNTRQQHNNHNHHQQVHALPDERQHPLHQGGLGAADAVRMTRTKRAEALVWLLV